MFGGGLNQVWPMAAVAHHYLDGFEQTFRGGAIDVAQATLVKSA